MIDLLAILNAASSVGNSISEFYSYLTRRAQTSNLKKKMVFRELRDNLKRLESRNKPKVKIAALIISLKNSAYTDAVRSGFNMSSLAHKKGVVVTESILIKARNKRYLDWGVEQLIDSIDSKIIELKDLVSYYDNLDDSNHNFRLKLSNLYYQILLLTILINQSKK